MKVTVVQNVLEANDRIAAENRALFDREGVFVINLMSSPGAGKNHPGRTHDYSLKDRYRIAVIEGDIQDTIDAERIAALEVPVVQINTQGACHLMAT